MIDFEYRINLLQARIERDLADGDEHLFWSGYVHGLRQYRDVVVRSPKADTVIETILGPLAFRRAGYCLGAVGESVQSAIAFLDKISSKNTDSYVVQGGACG